MASRNSGSRSPRRRTTTGDAAANPIGTATRSVRSASRAGAVVAFDAILTTMAATAMATAAAAIAQPPSVPANGSTAAPATATGAYGRRGRALQPLAA